MTANKLLQTAIRLHLKDAGVAIKNAKDLDEIKVKIKEYGFNENMLQNDWWSEFRAVCKSSFADDPQQMEKLGITVLSESYKRSKAAKNASEKKEKEAAIEQKNWISSHNLNLSPKSGLNPADCSDRRNWTQFVGAGKPAPTCSQSRCGEGRHACGKY